MNKFKNKPLIVLGDIHAAWSSLMYELKLKDVKDCNIICVGDIGIGFNQSEKNEHEDAQKLNNWFKEKDINFYGIRGNHDDPFYFVGKNRIVYENFELLEDYTVCKYNDKTIQFIGGAISIDRTGRKEGVSYWSNEGIIFDENKCKEVDVLITHTAPPKCFPQTFNEMVYGWAEQDLPLINDLTDERLKMDKIVNLCKPKYHFYGHFHSSWFEKIEDCVHRLLDINELFELKI